MNTILKILPENLVTSLMREFPSLNKIEEIRIRTNQYVEILWDGQSRLLPLIYTKEDVATILGRISKHSVYMLEEEMKRGFITIEGGHRIGLAGKVITEAGHVKRIRDVSSLNIRVAKEVLDCAKNLQPFLFEGKWKNTVLIGPPQSGKTTLLRDLARRISVGDERKGIQGMKVGVVDERSEISGCVDGVPQFQLGPRIDVLDSCPKAEGIMMLIRSMSPDVVVVDEISGDQDAKAIMEAVHAGVVLVLSAHGYTYSDFLNRPYFKNLLDNQVFERYVILSNRKGAGTIEGIYNEKKEKIYHALTEVRK